jgi:hypothetical protein
MVIEEENVAMSMNLSQSDDNSPKLMSSVKKWSTYDNRQSKPTL